LKGNIVVVDMNAPSEPDKPVPIQAIPQFIVPMVWYCSMSLFILNRLCELWKKGVRFGFERNFREVHLQCVCNDIPAFIGKSVPPTQVYNHMIKSKSMWFFPNMIKDVEGDHTTTFWMSTEKLKELLQV
jgi:hypothetical protein